VANKRVRLKVAGGGHTSWHCRTYHGHGVDHECQRDRFYRQRHGQPGGRLRGGSHL